MFCLVNVCGVVMGFTCRLALITCTTAQSSTAIGPLVDYRNGHQSHCSGCADFLPQDCPEHPQIGPESQKCVSPVSGIGCSGSSKKKPHQKWGLLRESVGCRARQPGLPN